MSQISQEALFKKLSDQSHIHQCSNRSCRQVRACAACGDASRNIPCHDCAGIRRPIWNVARDPQPCCRNNVRQETNRDELLRYQLAGPSPWYRCKTCARHSGWPLGFNPEKEKR